MFAFIHELWKTIQRFIGWGVSKVGEAVVSALEGAVEVVFGKLIGAVVAWIYGIVFGILNLVMQFLASVLVESGDTLRSCGSTGFSTTCLGSAWFINAYEGSIRVGAVLSFFAILVGVIGGLMNRSSGKDEDATAMAVITGLPKVALLYATVVAMTAYLVAAFDGLAFWWADWAVGSGPSGSGTAIEDVNDLLGAVTGATMGMGRSDLDTGIDVAVQVIPGTNFLAMGKLILVVVVFTLMILAMFSLGVILVIRAALIQIVLVFAPMVAVLLMTRWRQPVKSLLNKLLGLILIKPVIVIILGLGGAALGGGPEGAPGGRLFDPSAILDATLQDGVDGALGVLATLVVGLATLVMAVFSPMMVMNLVGGLGGGADAVSGPQRVAGKAMQAGYYARHLRGRGRGAASAALRTGVPGKV